MTHVYNKTWILFARAIALSGLSDLLQVLRAVTAYNGYNHHLYFIAGALVHVIAAHVQDATSHI
jgi:hypothetical protein